MIRFPLKDSIYCEVIAPPAMTDFPDKSEILLRMVVNGQRAINKTIIATIANCQEITNIAVI